MQEAISANNALERENEALQHEVEQKDELLCISDSICSRLFDMMDNIRREVQTAETLSPAIRSVSDTPLTQSRNNNASSTTVDQHSTTPSIELDPDSNCPAAIVEKIKAKYSEEKVKDSD